MHIRDLAGAGGVALGRSIHYYGFLMGALQYYTPGNDYRIFDIETGDSRVGTSEKYLEIIDHIQKKLPYLNK
ncbi:MAG: hypothetical protein ACC669_04480 [bacterium]